MLRQRQKLRKSKRINWRNIIKIALVVLVFGVVIFLLFFQTKYFDGERKLTLVIPSDKEVLVMVFDPETEEITTISIPQKTEVDVARNLGKWKIGSVWQLGQNEKIGGRLLAETITKNIQAPTAAWMSDQGLGLHNGGLKRLLSIIFLPLKTNLKIGDRLRLVAFCLRVKDYKKTDIPLEQTSYLKEQRLKDGEEGYLITGILPQKLLLTFADSYLEKQNARLSINTDGLEVNMVNKLGRIVEVLGAKVLSIKQQNKEIEDCLIKTKDPKLTKVMAEVLFCQVKKVNASEYDIELFVGKKFADRF